MFFFGKQKKVLAIITLISISLLVQIARLPLQAETTQAHEQKNSATTKDQPNQPGTFEKVAFSGKNPQKRTFLKFAFVVGVVAVAAVAGVLIAKALKSTPYDIRGTWDVILDGPLVGEPFDQWAMTFTGSKNSGTFYDSNQRSGTYTVNGSEITSIRYDQVTALDLVFVGHFVGEYKMVGEYTLTTPGTWPAYTPNVSTWTWTGVR